MQAARSGAAPRAQEAIRLSSEPTSAQTAPEWQLDSRLASDARAIGDLVLSQVLVLNDARFPWLLLVPRRANVVELIDLDPADQVQLTMEIAHASRVLRAVTACDKLNVAAIGNIVSQLHVHIIARRRTDAAWPKPVWGLSPPQAYEPAEFARFSDALRRVLGLDQAPR
jgi:diadenosine tetraphosphate (Ap4A) HIT family hydrolase